MTVPTVFVHPEGDGGAVLRVAGFSAEMFRLYREAAAGARYDKTKRASVVSDMGRLSAIVRRLRELKIPVKLMRGLEQSLADYEAARWLDVRASRERVATVERELAQRCNECDGKNDSEHPDDHPFVPKKLRAFQRPGIEWLSSREAGLLADDPGTGKSLQSLLSVPAGTGVLVICPGLAKYGVWPGEARKWRPSLKIAVLNGRGSFRWPAIGELVVVNYDILPLVHREGCPRLLEPACEGCSKVVPGAHDPACTKKRPVWCKGCTTEITPPTTPVALISDEAHMVKNPKSQRGEAVRVMARLVRETGGRVYPLTGTPLLNRPDELWTLLDAFDLAREVFPTKQAFIAAMGGKAKFVVLWDKKKRQKVRRRVGYEYETDGDIGVSPEVADRLQRVMLRRRVEDVLQDMPPKTVAYMPVEVDKKALKMCDELLEELGVDANTIDALLEETKGGAKLELWSQTCAALAMAKSSAAIDLIAQYEEQNEPVVVFSCYRAPIDNLGEREGWAAITGDVSSKRKGELVEAFQEGKLKGLACTIDAAGTGLTLTRARFCVFIDRKPVPGLNRQAEDRLCRIGQKRPVLITVLVANHALDQRISEIIKKKMRLIEGSVERAAQKEVHA